MFWQAIKNFFAKLFSFLSSSKTPSSVENSESKQNTFLLPLSWEKDHPERKTWSKSLYDLLSAKFDVFMKAVDLDEIRSDYKTLGREQLLTALGEFFSQIAKVEGAKKINGVWIPWQEDAQSVDVGQAGDKDTWSLGLMQMSVVDQENYGVKLGYSYQDLLTAVPNLTLAVEIMAKQIEKHGKIFIPKGESGVYWATIHPGGSYDQTESITKVTQALKLQQFSQNANVTDSKIKTPPQIPPWVAVALTMLGWTEFDHDKELSVYWKWTNVPGYKTVIGTTYAWCALFVGACLDLCGIRSSRDAGADSYASYGKICDFWFGSICPIRHADGGHHVTFFLYWIDEENRIAACLGGNQSNAVNVTAYNLSGNSKGHDEIMGGKTRSPFEQGDGQKLTMAQAITLDPRFKVTNWGAGTR